MHHYSQEDVTGVTVNPAVADDDWGRCPQPLDIDSGASATVLPQDWFTNYKKVESEGSKVGEYWRAANNAKIFNLGERTLQLLSLDGNVQRSMTFQVASVGKALGSVSKIVHTNNRVVFDPAGSYIESLSDGSVLPLREDNGVFVLDAWVAPAKDSGQQAVFPRPGMTQSVVCGEVRLIRTGAARDVGRCWVQ